MQTNTLKDEWRCAWTTTKRKSNRWHIVFSQFLFLNFLFYIIWSSLLFEVCWRCRYYCCCCLAVGRFCYCSCFYKYFQTSSVFFSFIFSIEKSFSESIYANWKLLYQKQKQQQLNNNITKEKWMTIHVIHVLIRCSTGSHRQIKELWWCSSARTKRRQRKLFSLSSFPLQKQGNSYFIWHTIYLWMRLTFIHCSHNKDVWLQCSLSSSLFLILKMNS